MGICEKCIHANVCEDYEPYETVGCNQFKDKSLILKLPCKIGDKLFEVDGEIYHWRVKRIVFSCCDTEYQCISTELDEFREDFTDGELEDYEDETEFYASDIGETVFLTREEAEKALKEREK